MRAADADDLWENLKMKRMSSFDFHMKVKCDEACDHFSIGSFCSFSLCSI